MKPLKDVLSFWYLDKWYVQELYKTPARYISFNKFWSIAEFDEFTNPQDPYRWTVRSK
ncbi:hypothetical protein HYP07_gp017 [Vibrio phage JSF3]|uniref:Uncharacterized protein n=2 Tax=Pacinivirus VCO139 TaxID=2846607 RepID=R9R4C6_9CAUD|nr:hypothetical protein M612_gp31 [Vibrio phage JA-1]YP_009874374.1 hypothetical protein HYO77_gp31 [Vibrio phage VCO139]YP_009876242.1 hypothetical protein HYP07_gp017 [Vibrio phage JSF3]AGI61824.1 hypothetical protein JA1_0072 [Vibrio phage JA-1]AGI61899.1 hypothetical protein VCO139_0073 [Vibrio phage VCO139]APD18029.1 hypothetical protein [Vibrio phage JSF3]